MKAMGGGGGGLQGETEAFKDRWKRKKEKSMLTLQKTKCQTRQLKCENQSNSVTVASWNFVVRLEYDLLLGSIKNNIFWVYEVAFIYSVFIDTCDVQIHKIKQV